MSELIRPDDAQAEEALDLVVACQTDPATACAYVGTERAGIAAELADLDQPWRETARVALRDGAVVALALAEYDEELGRSWIHGPWAADPAAWEEHAAALVDAMIAQAPDVVDDHEVSAAPAHTALAALAGQRGWHASPVNYAYVARSADGWPAESGAVRRATEADLDAVQALHDLAFPGTYLSARRMLADEERVTFVLDGDAGLDGYASAEVKPDGEGYLDFLAVAPHARGRGLSKALLATIGRAMLASSPHANVNLTVREDNRAAVALYESFGFVRDAELVGYRSRPYDA